MSRFREELGVIPRAAWIVFFIAYAGIAIGIHFAMATDPEMSRWPLPGALAFNLLIPVLPCLLILFFGYIYGDARRRRMNAIAWMLLAIFVPYLIGAIIYFCIREPLPVACGSCQTVVPAKFTFCPQCGKNLHPYCPQCGKGVESGWVNCAFCGAKLPG